MPRISPAITGKIIASRMLIKNEINVHATNTSVIIKILNALNTIHGTMSPRLDMMKLQVTMRDRIMLVTERLKSTMRITLLLSSIMSSVDQTARVTYNVTLRLLMDANKAIFNLAFLSLCWKLIEHYGQ